MSFWAGSTLVERIALAVLWPEVLAHVRAAVALDLASLLGDDLALGTRAASVEFFTDFLLGIEHKVFKAATLCEARLVVVAKVLAGRARADGLLFKALAGLIPVVRLPFWAALAAGGPRVRVQEEQLTWLTGTNCELPAKQNNLIFKRKIVGANLSYL